eukprot:15475735-Alexandrium_andersonii.AAC.1
MRGRVLPVSERRARAGKGPIGGMWVDHNKGYSDTPNVRSRYVAKAIAFFDDSLFAAAPPLEALRLLFSALANGRRA